MKKLTAVLLAGLFASSAWAEVTLRIEWQLNGPLAELEAFVKEGVALQKKINPKVRHNLWVNVVHGENAGSASILVTFEDLAHYAEATIREEANDEWNTFIARFNQSTFPPTFAGLTRTLVGSRAEPAGEGAALGILAFAGGDVAGLEALVEQAAEIQSRVNPQAEISMVMPIVSGQVGPSAIVLTRYPSIVAWAEGGEKLQASQEWGDFLSAFPADKYQVVYQGLSRAAAIR